MKKCGVFILLILLLSLGLADRNPLELRIGTGRSWLRADKSGEAYGLNIALGYHFTPRFMLNISHSYAKFTTNSGNIKASHISPYQVYGRFYLLDTYQCSCISPFFDLGGGIINYHISPDNYYSGDPFWQEAAFAGLGLDIPLSSLFSLKFSTRYTYINTDKLEGIESGKKDSFMEVKAGLGINLMAILPAGKNNDLDELYHVHYSNNHDTVEAINRDSTNRIVLNPEDWIGPATDNDSSVQLQNNESNNRAQLKGEKKNQAPYRENTEKLKHLLEERKQVIDSLQKELQQLQRKMTKKSVKSEKIDSSTTKTQTTEDIIQEYQTGLQLYRKQEYLQALEKFKRLFNKYSEDTLAGNFVYWIGESYYGLEIFKKAAEYFDRMENYPESSKRDDALLMLGHCYRRMGDTEKAKHIYRKLISQFPDSEYIENKHLQQYY